VDWDLAFAVALIGLASAVSAAAFCAARRAMPRRRGGGRPASPPLGPAASDLLEERFIPMPGDLSTHDEMVAWMTRDLPRLTAEPPDPRPGGARPGGQSRRSGTRRV
jgi:hypothetical protein